MCIITYGPRNKSLRSERNEVFVAYFLPQFYKYGENTLIILKEIFHNKFAKNVTMIAGGTAFAQLLSALSSPIITRLYNPQEYGVLTVYTAFLGLIAIVASLKYEWAISIAENDEKAINVMGLCFWILVTFTIIISTIIFLLGEVILNLLNANVLINYKYLIPIGAFFIGSYNILMQWSFRRKNFKAIARTKLSQSIVGNGVRIGLGLLGFGPVGLILGQIFTQGAGLGTLSRPFIKQDKHLLQRINRREIRWSAKRYKDFALFSAPSQILNMAGLQLPVFFITAMYGSQVVGLYGLANGIINLPMQLIGNSVADVFYGEAASIGRADCKRLKDLSSKLFQKLLIIGLIPLLLLLCFGPFLFSFVFGSQWYEAGVYARILSLMVFTRFIFTPMSRIFFILEKQKEAFMLDLSRVILVLVSFGVSVFFELNPHLAISLYSVAMSIVYLITYIIIQKVLKEK